MTPREPSKVPTDGRVDGGDSGGGGGEEQETVIAAGGQRLRVRVRPGHGVPLVMCNGIGAGLEVLDPLAAALDAERPIIRFDVPGTGESPASVLPYGLPYLAWVLGKVLDKLQVGVVDVLGLSWGGALAQQFAFQNPRRCRSLVLVATSTGALMVPGHPRVLSKMITPRRFRDPDYAGLIAESLYGGSVRTRSAEVAELLRHQLHHASRIGYVHQLLAGSVWTSLFALPLIRQRTLILAGTDDPIIPTINAKVLEKGIPRSTLVTHDGGHIDVILEAETLSQPIEEFLGPARVACRPWPPGRRNAQTNDTNNDQRSRSRTDGHAAGEEKADR